MFSLAFVIYPMMRWLQLPGAAWSVVISSLFMSTPFFIFAPNITGFKIQDLLKKLLPTITGTIIMALPVVSLLHFVNTTPIGRAGAFISLTGIIFLGAAVYFISTYFIGKRIYYISISRDISYFFDILLNKLSSKSL